MKVAIDCGHGMASSGSGFDPGAVNGAFREADIVLNYGRALGVELSVAGWEHVMLRVDNTTPSPLGMRVKIAQIAGCDVLISFHCNSFITVSATGVETLYNQSKKLAQLIQKGLVKALQLTDRGVKHRPGLAILKFPQSALIELGFISNPYDLARIMQPDSPSIVAAEVRAALQEFFEA